MLQFENVSTFYGKIQALHSVNVEIRQEIGRAHV